MQSSESKTDSQTSFTPSATSAAEEHVFKPFEETFICSGCNRPLQLLVQPVHQDMDINCPRCFRSMNYVLRRAIRERLQT